MNVGYYQNLKCNPQTEPCLSVSTNQGVIYIPNTGIYQQGVLRNPQCNPSTQSCRTENTAQRGIYITSNLPNCNPEKQNCASQVNTQGNDYNRQSTIIQNAGSIPVYTPHSQTSHSSSSSHVSGCGSNCGQVVGQESSYGSVTKASSSGGQEGIYGSRQYGGAGSQNYGNTGNKIQYSQSTNQEHVSSQIRSHTSHGVIRCPDGFQGLTKHPTDCSKFLNCANGQTYIQDCAPGTLFNPKLGNCDFPYNVDCETSQTSSGGIDSSWKQTQHGKSKEFHINKCNFMYCQNFGIFRSTSIYFVYIFKYFANSKLRLMFNLILGFHLIQLVVQKTAGEKKLTLCKFFHCLTHEYE